MKPLRRGFTLIELLAVMAVFSVTLTSIVLTLHALQKSGDRLRESLDAGIQQDRFTQHLRTDAHVAQACTLAPADQAGAAAPVLQLTLPGQQTVEYRLLADRIERLVRSGEAVQHRETYRMEPVLPTGWTVATNGVRPLVTVHLQRPLVGAPFARRSLPPWRIDAALTLFAPDHVTTAGESVP